mmetsp:Transcript_13167/g.31186  ORF Transcript_13167/g.31186 Transcript_13167/m.31186 type:complete len:234 (-) Transcript_13167:6-707(-)
MRGMMGASWGTAQLDNASIEFQFGRGLLRGCPQARKPARWTESVASDDRARARDPPPRPLVSRRRLCLSLPYPSPVPAAMEERKGGRFCPSSAHHFVDHGVKLGVLLLPGDLGEEGQELVLRHKVVLAPVKVLEDVPELPLRQDLPSEPVGEQLHVLVPDLAVRVLVDVLKDALELPHPVSAHPRERILCSQRSESGAGRGCSKDSVGQGREGKKSGGGGGGVGGGGERWSEG